MRNRFILIVALLCPALAYGSQAVGTVNVSSTTGADAVAPSMTNTAGDFLFTFAYVSCTSTNPNSVFAYQVNSNVDSNGNPWNMSIDSRYTFSSTTRALYFLWTTAPINAGANVVTYSHLVGDCKIAVGIQNEYAGFFAFNSNPNSYRVNNNFMPNSTPDANTTYPINANATYTAPPSFAADLTVSVAISEGGTGGTWSANGSWSQVTTSSPSGLQMVEYDGTTGTAPGTIQIGNTGSSFTHAFGEWVQFNRIAPSPPGNCGQTGVTCSVACSNFDNTSGASTSCGPITLSGGETLIAAFQTFGGSSYSPWTITGCGFDSVPQFDQWVTSNTGGGYGGVMLLRSATAGTCTPTATLPVGSGVLAKAFQIEKITGLPPYPIEANLFALGGTQVTSTISNIPVPEANSIGFLILGSTNIGPNPPCFAGMLSTSWNGVGTTVGQPSGHGECTGLNMSALGASGPTSVSAALSTTSEAEVFYLALRSVAPSAPEFVQGGTCSTSYPTGALVTTMTCALDQVETVGDQVQFWIYRSSQDPFPTITNADGWTCTQRPPGYAAEFMAYVAVCPVTSVSSSPNVFTITTSIARNFDVMLVESSAHGYMWGSASSMDADTATPSTSPQSVGPMWIRQSGTFYSSLAFAFTAVLGLGTDGLAVQTAPVSPYRLRMTPQYHHGGDGISLYADARITNGSTALAQTATLDPLGQNVVNGLSMWGFGSVPYLKPVMLQSQPLATTGSTYTATFNEPVANGALVACAAGGTDLVFTSSPSLTWLPEQGCGISDKFCMAVAFGVPAGSVDVTLTTSGSKFFSYVSKYSGFNAVDVSNWQHGTGPLGPVDLTSTHPNEIGIGCNMITGLPTGSNTTMAGISGTDMGQKVPSASAGSFDGSMWEFDATTVQTYGATCTSELPDPPIDCAMIILGFPSVVSTTQPFVNLITHNDPDRYTGEFKKWGTR